MGATSYGLYMYQNNYHDSEEWKNKLEKHCFKTIMPTANMVFGTKHEKVVLDLFTKKYNNAVVWRDCGFTINSNYPWLGYSADAFITMGNETRLLEAKCPKLGKTEHGIDFFRGFAYMAIAKTGEVTLRKKHKYYGQVQLGMAL